MAPDPTPQPETLALFPTVVYRARLGLTAMALADLARACQSVMEDDAAGHAWCAQNHYLGYTSYASLNDLPWRMPEFAELAAALQPHLGAFAQAAAFALDGKALEIDSLWVNVLPPGAGHSGHIHPHAVVSGTFYVQAPNNAAPLRFEDPRLPLMMAAPLRRPDAPPSVKPFYYLQPEPGDVVLWESWLRHEVPPHEAEEERISISFNARIGG